MAEVYILYSRSRDKYYIGSCNSTTLRTEQHLSNYFQGGFTSSAKDWEVFYVIQDLGYAQARKIELHIKRMKSRAYIMNLKKFPGMTLKLIEKYC